MCILNYFSWPSLFFSQHFILIFIIILTLSLTYCSSLNQTSNRFRSRESKTTLEKQNFFNGWYKFPCLNHFMVKDETEANFQGAYLWAMFENNSGAGWAKVLVFANLGVGISIAPCSLSALHSWGWIPPLPPSSLIDLYLPPQAQCNTLLFSQFLTTKF